jgi:hypothetical protein
MRAVQIRTFGEPGIVLELADLAHPGCVQRDLSADVQSAMLTELLAFLDELLSYLESVRDVRGEDGPAGRSPQIERLTQKTRALRDAVSAERQKR